jgi:hypothetical protein
MQVQQDSVFKNEEMVLDGNGYDNCWFENCTLWYKGGDPPEFSNCQFISCNWRLGDIPMNTIKFIASLKVSGIVDLADWLVAALQGIKELPEAPIN